MALLCAAIAGVVGVAAIAHALRAPLPAGGVSLCLLLTDQAECVEGLVGEALCLTDRLSPLVRDLVVVDAGSTDGTGDILTRIGLDRPALKLLLLPDRESARWALDAAEAQCGGTWLLARRFPSRSGSGHGSAAPHPV